MPWLAPILAFAVVHPRSGIELRRSCAVIGRARMTLRYCSRRSQDGELGEGLTALSPFSFGLPARAWAFEEETGGAHRALDVRRRADPLLAMLSGDQ